MKRYKLKGEKRKVLGRKVKKLRKEGFLPANLYGKKIKSLAISLDGLEFEKVFQATGETGLIDLTIDKSTMPVLVGNVQTNPVTDKIIHIDFRQVDLTEKVVATVPIEVTGVSPTEKAGEGVLVQQLNEIEVEALPSDLPEKFVVDVGQLVEVDSAILVKDLNYDKNKVKLKISDDQIIAKVEAPQKEEEPAPVVAEEEKEEEKVEEEAEEEKEEVAEESEEKTSK